MTALAKNRLYKNLVETNLAKTIFQKEVSNKKVVNKNRYMAIEHITRIHRHNDSFITLCVKNKKHEKMDQWHYSLEEIKDNIDRIVTSENDVYISVNAFYTKKRSLETIRRINANYLDFDNHEVTKLSKSDIEAFMFFFNEYVNDRLVPEPSLVIATGRGIQVYWILEDLPKQAINYWSIIQDEFLNIFKDFEVRGIKVDKSVKDIARVLRIAGTKNTSAGVNSYILQDDYLKNNNVYRLDQLTEIYFPQIQDFFKIKKLEREELKKKNSERKIQKVIIHDFYREEAKRNRIKEDEIEAKVEYTQYVLNRNNWYKLHIARHADIIKLLELRNGMCRNEKGEFTEFGQREFMCFLYRYYSCMYVGNTEDGLNLTLEFNNKFKIPLTEKEVINATKSAENGYVDWLGDRENRKVYKKRRIVNNGKYHYKGYNYKTETLVKLLNITKEEQKHMKNLIGPEEKSERDKAKKKESRRNENNLTSREQQKQDLIFRVKVLKEKGLKQKEIAAELGIAKSTVSKYLKY